MKIDLNTILQGDALEVLKTLPENSIDCVMTSPPYWALRDYGVKGQLGLEPTFQEYIDKLCNIFDEVKRVLKKTGTCWVNLGDTYAAGGGKAIEQSFKRQAAIDTGSYPSDAPNSKLRSSMPKCLLQIPSRFSIEMCNRGWILRNTIIWYKPNCMPSSVNDRFTVDYEYLFFFTKNKKYWFEQQFDEYTEPMNRWGGEKLKAQGESTWDKGTGQETYRDRDMRPNPEGRNKRCVWKICPKPFSKAHFAVFPEELCETPIKAGCPKKGIVLDPFSGAGTTCVVGKKLNRNYVGIELNPEYIKIAENRLMNTMGSLF